MNKKACIFLLLSIPLGSWIPISNFHYLNYDIFVSENKIGELRALKNETGPVTTYSIQTTIAFKVFEEYDINYQLSTSYKNNQLIETSLKNRVNGSVENDVYLKWNGTKYQGHNNKTPVILESKIHNSIARLYFHEPIGVTKVFSEKLMKFQPLRANRKNEYVLNLEDENRSKYTYRNGICTEVNSNKSFLKVLIKLRPSS